MKLSVLMPTHNRPKLFNRALSSVLRATDNFETEIIVNNDTNDIDRLSHDNISYHTHTSVDLSDIYKHLYDLATGEYILFVEDDDYLLPDRFNRLSLTHDIHYLEYMSNPLICEHGIKRQHEITCINRAHADIHKPIKFYNSINKRYFQLSQIIFKRPSIITFPTGNDKHNDERLFREIAYNSRSIKYEKGPAWVQTVDGHDNISFDNLNKDERFC